MKKSSGTRIPGLKSGKTKQYLAVAAVLAALYGGMYLIFSSGGKPKKTVATNSEVETTHVRAPGSQVDARDAWIGGAGQDVARMREQLNRQNQEFERLSRRFHDLQEKLTKNEATGDTRAATPEPVAAPSESVATHQPVISPSPFPPASPGEIAQTLTNGGGALPATIASNLRGTPVKPVASSGPPVRALGQFKVVANASSSAIADELGITGKVKDAVIDAAAGKVGKGKAADRYAGETFLPVGMVKADLIGGIDAPTGGQAQNNPLPVFLRITDLSILPNHFRANVKDCFAVGAAYGELSAERAYARVELLSCIRHDGQVLETPVSAVVYDETGKLGMRGYVRTKQGQVLANALMAGVVSGIGRGFAMSATDTSTSALGTVSTTSGSDAYRAGLGQGVSRALDRLANYWITVAEQMFPVIEVHGGRQVSIAFTKGVTLPVPLPDSSKQLALGYFDED